MYLRCLAGAERNEAQGGYAAGAKVKKEDILCSDCSIAL
jgi:hypothetical protein